MHSTDTTICRPLPLPLPLLLPPPPPPPSLPLHEMASLQSGDIFEKVS